MASKITFPNRACPKCGKPVHIKSKSHDCGWMASAGGPMGKSAKAESANGKPTSKMDAVRRILAESGHEIKPLDIQVQLKTRFNLKMDAGTISNYKSTILKQGTRKKKLGRPKGKKLGRPPGIHAPGKTMMAGSISIADIQAVKSLAERLGAEKLRQLAEVLA